MVTAGSFSLSFVTVTETVTNGSPTCVDASLGLIFLRPDLSRKYASQTWMELSLFLATPTTAAKCWQVVY